MALVYCDYMSQPYDPFNALKKFRNGKLYSLPALEAAGVGKISRLPVSIRIVLESVLRNCDGKKIREEDVRELANWNAKKPSSREIPFVVSRILLQDFTGVPLVVDLAAMRDAVAEVGKSPELIEPLVPLDLVIDHSIQVDEYGTAMAFKGNVQKEFERNRERYEFLKWGQEAFDTFQVVPPAVGICHQVNLEYLAKLVFEKKINDETLYYLDTLVGTDSHTTMINGLGVVGWGVGGIEAEAGMLGQPVYFQTPEVIGVHLTGALKEGVTATDLTLNITQLLRTENVVGKFVEFFGAGAASLTVADRATIGNMAPEYGATIGLFPIDDKTKDYLLMTGRPKAHVEMVEDYCKAQGIWGMPRDGEVDYTKVIELDLSTIVPCVAGPKRPQDRINLTELKEKFSDLFHSSVKEGGYGKAAETYKDKASITLEKHGDEKFEIKHGSVLIAAITSCTNTSNPSVMVAAGLVAKKAVELGLKINPIVKTSLAPGSRVVTDYLAKTGLQEYLDKLGFNLVGYGCTTCIGNSGPLDLEVEKAIKEKDLVCASVLSGNRNFEARIQPAIRANFLMSPPLVVAFALAGKVDIDFVKEPLGKDKNGKEVYLQDLWPTNKDIHECVIHGLEPEMFLDKYSASAIDQANPEWNAIKIRGATRYHWDSESTYIQKPPYFDDFSMDTKPIKPINGMRALAILGDSVTTDHVSPAGAIAEDGPAGRYLKSLGVEKKDFNSYGSRRGNDRVMTRGTFGNVRIKNQMAQGKEGGYTTHMPDGELMSIYDAAMVYKKENVPLIVLSGNDYGMGSSRDWAAKGTLLLGVKVVVAKNFERIHRSNLIGMGVLPLQFKEGESVESWGLDGTEIYSLPDFVDDFEPGDEIKMEIWHMNGKIDAINLIIRIDTHIEKDYYKHGGIMPYVLRSILKQ